MLYTYLSTSSSAVAERLRVALCSSVVSFNSAIYLERSLLLLLSASDHLPLHTIKCRSVVFGATLRILVIHFVVVSRQKQTPSLTSDCVSSTRWSVAAKCSALRVRSTSWSHILAQNRDFCLPHRHLTPPLGGFRSEYCHSVCYGKTKMVWLSTVKKFRRYLYSF